MTDFYRIGKEGLKKFRSSVQQRIIPPMPTGDEQGYIRSLEDLLHSLRQIYPTPVEEISNFDTSSELLVLLIREHKAPVQVALAHLRVLGLLYATNAISWEEAVSKAWTGDEVNLVLGRDAKLLMESRWLSEVITRFIDSVIRSWDSAKADADSSRLSVEGGLSPLRDHRSG